MSKAIGTGDHGPDDGPDVTGADHGLWVRGVDYMAGWRVARAAADQVNLALLAAEFDPSQLRAVASTDDVGRGVVRLVGAPGAAVRLAGLLAGLVDDDGGTL
ncbi:hypothetical protein AQJ58_37655 [Streptomyces sp. DSM 15324]|nr:hypothetical protein AQJ58_37655 [Streptomyces sp. DSM 15324]